MDANTLADRLFRDATGMLELCAVYLGERLGYYRALAEGGPATSTELAERTGTAERYAREWLEHHAACGLVEVDDPSAGGQTRRYTLPAEHIPVLADRDAPSYQGYLGVDLVRAARRMADVAQAYRTGGAPPDMPWEPEGRAEPNRPEFLHLLGREWLPAIKDLDARLRADPPARVADLACGTGWSTIATAEAYPKITVQGIDLDTDAIAAARGHAAARGVADRVSFDAIDAGRLTGPGYQLVMIIEALHDMTRPVEVLRTARDLLTEDGSVLVVDTRAEERFTAPAPQREQYEYGWSLIACLPDAMGDPDTAATGTVIRPATVHRYATEAGFTNVEILPIETDNWRFYRLTSEPWAPA